MSSNATSRLDPLKIALGVFVLLGIGLTTIGGYAIVLATGGSPSISVNSAVSILSGISLLAFVVVASKAFDRRTSGRNH